MSYTSFKLLEILKCYPLNLFCSLGERLGFSGIKLALPIDLVTECSYLGLYCSSILALQRKYGRSTTIPLAIMTR